MIIGIIVSGTIGRKEYERFMSGFVGFRVAKYGCPGLYGDYILLHTKREEERLPPPI